MWQKRSNVAATCAAIATLMQEGLPEVHFHCSQVEEPARPVHADVHVFAAHDAPQEHIEKVGTFCRLIAVADPDDIVRAAAKAEQYLRRAKTREQRNALFSAAMSHLCDTDS